MASNGRIMFVDDEPRLLRSLERGLRRHKGDWELRFAHGADEALAALDAEHVDILISDVTMPGTNGVELLSQVRDVCPEATRILMSGTSDGRLMMRAVPVAHRFLDKPVPIRELARVIEEALAMRELLCDPAIRSVVSRVESLPSIPRAFDELNRALDDPNMSLRAIAAVVERDPGICAKLLHITGSAFFAAPRPVDTVEDAVRHIGTALLRDLVLVAGVFRMVEAGDLPIGFDLDAEYDHSLRVAQAARVLADPPHQGAAYTAGLLHDAGKLLFAAELPEVWGPMMERVLAERLPLHIVEQQQLGVTHAQLGGYLFGIWGLRGEVVNAVVNHHHPLRPGPLDATRAVQLADALVNADDAGEPLSDDELEEQGFADRVRLWRDTCC